MRRHLMSAFIVRGCYTLYAQEKIVRRVWGRGGSRGKSGSQRSLASVAFVRCQPSICHDNLGKILRVVLSQLDKRGISEGAGKLHEHHPFECVIATINDR